MPYVTLFALGSVFVILELAGAIAWGWWLVTIPFMMVGLIIVWKAAVITAILVFALCMAIVQKVVK